MARLYKNLSALLITVAVLALFITAWQLATMLVSKSSLLPPPARVFHAAVEMYQSGELLQDVAASLKRILVGFLLALAAGLVIGIIAARYIKTYRRVAIILDLLSSIPPIAWTPLAILWFGIGNAPAYFIVFLGAFFPLFTSVYAGITRTEKKLIEAALTLGASKSKVVSGVILPSSLRYILTGITTAIGVGWFNVIAAELIGVRSGLGYKIQLSRTLLFSENVIALMLVIGILGWVMVHIVAFIGNLIAPWGVENETRPRWIAQHRRVCNIFVRIASSLIPSKSISANSSSEIELEERGSPNLIHSMDKTSLLSVSNLFKSFPIQEGEGIGTLDVLKDIDFSVNMGEVFTIIGPNGSGKTTLIRILAGLESPDSGETTFQEHHIGGPGRDRTLIFQDFALFPWRTAAGNIDFALSASNSMDGNRQAIIDGFLNDAGLSKFADVYPADLSGGMKQRLAVIRALAVKPTIVLMDEPFASLDPLIRESSQEAIRSLLQSNPVTVLLVTHDLDEAIFMSNRILVLSPQPGHIKKIITIDLPSERTAETRKSPEFHAIRNQLWDILRSPM